MAEQSNTNNNKVGRQRGRPRKIVTKKKSEATSKLVDDGSSLPRRAKQKCEFASSDHVYASEEARRYMLEKAEQLRSQLVPSFPSFVKTMRPSHVYATFWLGLPTRFCKEHLPKEDSAIVLVAEDKVEYRTVYLAKRAGLSGGWRLFAVKHRLHDGDALVFQLTNPTTLKVYVLRADDYAVDAAADILQDLANGVEPSSNESQAAGQEQTAANNSTSAGEDDGEEEEEEATNVGAEEGQEELEDCGRCQRIRRCGDSREGPKCCFQCFELKERARREAAEAEAVARENEELRISNSCKVCMQVNLSVLLLPCKHLCLCEACEPKLQLCPICNSAKLGMVQVSLV